MTAQGMECKIQSVKRGITQDTVIVAEQGNLFFSQDATIRDPFLVYEEGTILIHHEDAMDGEVIFTRSKDKNAVRRIPQHTIVTFEDENAYLTYIEVKHIGSSIKISTPA
jgi:hypothetical protein